MEEEPAGGLSIKRQEATKARVNKAAARAGQLAAARAQKAARAQEATQDDGLEEEEAKGDEAEGDDAPAQPGQDTEAGRLARLKRINDGDLQARLDACDLMIDMPAPSDFSRASRDPIAALHLLHYNTGLAGNEALAALHELKYCNLTAEQRAEETQAARAALDREREDSEKAQDGIRKAYVGRVNETRIFYVCACCGERNDEGVGQYQLFTQERLEPLRYTGSAEDVERWGRIERAHALVDGPRVWSCL